ncbi:alpha-amylase family glycosyl hydrolase [Neptunitalea lumnitzerae]|uniref:Alpha-amylase n=1 Tax=Neptunitalea lumnitzerae TaxID=2965509 RepID=A0ABQ5MHZ3_9FLAO|nr:alpha-amylase family glycosyl hydrolase [Neptunitalea sp. Y10]GLB49000.1 alpha-amylase [Neptunitalea sp. Y10]
MKRIFIPFLLILAVGFFSISCDSDDDNTQQVSFDYEQYGETFTNMPSKEDAIIYQVNITSFSDEGTLNAVTANLQHIKNLGANVVYLMPIYPIGEVNSIGSPYSVKDYTSVNPNLGTLADLRTLVETAHSLDMAVILDWVANHTAWDHPWITEHPEYYQQDNEGNIISPPNTNYTDVAQLNYTMFNVREAMVDALAYWVYNTNIDGFRFDYADGMPFAFYSDGIAALRTIKNQEMLFLAEGDRTNHFDAGFDYIFGFNYYGALKTAFNSGNANGLQSSSETAYSSVAETDRIVRYTTNHDVNHTDGTPNALFGGQQGANAAFVLASYMRSVPFIYNGQEVGYNQQLTFFSPDPIDWSMADYDVYAEYQKILAFRQNSEALKTGTFTGYSNGSVVAFTMETTTETVLVMVNVANNNTTYTLPEGLSQTGWVDAYSGTDFTTDGTVALAPYQYIVVHN